MGKCVECKTKDSSYRPPGDTASRRWCKPCAQRLHPDAVPCYKPKPKKRRGGALPLQLDEMPRRPCIVASLGPGWLEKFVTAEQLRESARRGEWTPETTLALDLTTGTKLEAVAYTIGTELCGEGYAPMAAVQLEIARAMNINETACCGLNRAGNHTAPHQHSPMGVMQLLGGTGAAKEWHFWPPGAKDDDAQRMVLHQRAGDVLFFPPSWWHEVITSAGDIVETGERDVVAPNWVTWCLPRHMALQAGYALAVNATSEDQRNHRTTGKQNRKIYDAIVTYVDA